MAKEAGPGPIPVKNHHPLYIALLHPTPESTAPVSDMVWEFSIDHTNIYLFNWDDKWAAYVDKEVTEAAAAIRYPIEIADIGVEAGASIPLYTSSGGSLDKFIRWWHNLLGAPSYLGQEESPDFRYVDQLYYNDQLIIDGVSGDIFMGDATLWIKAPITYSELYHTSFQVFLSPPTGDVEKGGGSGAWEAGARVLAAGSLDTGLWSAGAGLFIPNALMRDEISAQLSVMAQGFASWEVPITPKTWFVVQSMFSSSPLSNADLYQFSRPFLDITFGLTYQRSEAAPLFIFGFSENLTQTAPDFTIHLSFRM